MYHFTDEEKAILMMCAVYDRWQCVCWFKSCPLCDLVIPERFFTQVVVSSMFHNFWLHVNKTKIYSRASSSVRLSS